MTEDRDLGIQPSDENINSEEQEKNVLLESINEARISKNWGSFGDLIESWSILYPDELENLSLTEEDSQGMRSAFDKLRARERRSTAGVGEAALVAQLKIFSPEVFDQLNTQENWDFLKNRFDMLMSDRDAVSYAANMGKNMKLIRPESVDEFLRPEIFDKIKTKTHNFLAEATASYRGVGSYLPAAGVASSARVLFPERFMDLNLSPEQIKLMVDNPPSLYDTEINYNPVRVKKSVNRTRFSYKSDIKILTANSVAVSTKGLVLS